MSKITFPPLPPPDILVREDFGLGDSTVHQGYTAEQMQERDRQIAEQVVRACAEMCEKIADTRVRMHLPSAVADQCADAILAMLPMKGQKE